jgi:hypothetical protein
VHFRSFFALAFTLTFSSAAASAQRATRVDATAGTRVRLKMTGETLRTAGHYMIEGTLVGADSGRVIVQETNHAAPDTVQMFTVDQFEVYAGRHSRKKMILAGAAGGAAISLVARGMDNLTRGARCEHGCSEALVPGYLYAAPVVIGALIGAVFPADRWKALPRDAMAVSLATHGQLQISSAIRFR